MGLLRWFRRRSAAAQLAQALHPDDDVEKLRADLEELRQKLRVCAAAQLARALHPDDDSVEKLRADLEELRRELRVFQNPRPTLIDVPTCAGPTKNVTVDPMNARLRADIRASIAVRRDHEALVRLQRF